MVKLAMYSLLIVITFFGVGAFSGKLFVKFPDREQREEKLMWIFLTFLMMYFASGFCIQMITGHKGFSLSLVETITMQKVAPIAGLFLCAAVIFALEIPAASICGQFSNLICLEKSSTYRTCYRRKEFYDSWYFGVWHFLLCRFLSCV